ncbi:hypothetical protein AVEN_19996-1 [Araneus ventricosus]|uniref:Uncharacterized protein n=1 Tax=Araneus ventricosus TaxID=182803 RepID=A0A4Y2PVQ8_ARAVE|nr:hypothetical protein AVEN_19996-1 [Araneus ventricosus]
MLQKVFEVSITSSYIDSACKSLCSYFCSFLFYSSNSGRFLPYLGPARQLQKYELQGLQRISTGVLYAFAFISPPKEEVKARQVRRSSRSVNQPDTHARFSAIQKECISLLDFIGEMSGVPIMLSSSQRPRNILFLEKFLRNLLKNIKYSLLHRRGGMR